MENVNGYTLRHATLRHLSYEDRRRFEFALQMLNTRGNLSLDGENVLDILRYCARVLKDATSSQFVASLKNSADVFFDTQKKMQAFNRLADNNPDDFLILPITSSEHLFAGLLRKRGGFYSLTAINKGYIPRWEAPFSEYIFNQAALQRLFMRLDKHLQKSKASLNVSIEQVYSLLKANALHKFVLAVRASPQKEENCGVKEPEAAIKFALATAKFRYDDFKKLQYAWDSFEPKWHQPTYMMHRSIILEITKDSPALLEVLRDEFENYVINKCLKNYLQASDNPLDALVNAFTQHPKYSRFSSEHRFSHCLARLRLDTLLRFPDEIRSLANMSADPQHAKAIHTILKYHHMRQLPYDAKVEKGNKIIADFVMIKNTFPVIYEQLKHGFASRMYDMGMQAEQQGQLFSAKAFFKRSIRFDPLNGNALLSLAYVKGRLYQFESKKALLDHAYRLNPMLRYHSYALEQGKSRSNTWRFTADNRNKMKDIKPLQTKRAFTMEP